MVSKRNFLYLLALLLLAYTVFHYVQTGILFSYLRNPVGGDFAASWPTFWGWKINPNFMLQNPLAIGWTSPFPERPDSHPWIYGPLIHFILFPFLFFDSFKTASHVWLFFCHLFLLITMYLWYKILFIDKKLHSFFVLSIYIAAWLNFFPLYEGLTSRVIEIFELFLLTLAFYLYVKKRENLSGIFLGLATMTKFLPLIFIPYFFIKKKYRMVCFSLLTILIIGIVTEFTLEWRDSATLYQVLKIGRRVTTETNYECQTVPCWIYRLLSTPPIPSRPATYGFGFVKDPLFAQKMVNLALCLLAALYGTLLLWFRKYPITILEIGMLFILMISWPHRSHPYYLIFILVPLSFALYYLVDAFHHQRLKKVDLFFITLVFFLSAVFFPLSIMRELFQFLSFPPFLGFYQFYCIPVIAFLLLLFWLAKKQISYHRKSTYHLDSF